MRYATWTWGVFCAVAYLALLVLFSGGGAEAAFVMFSGLIVMPVVWGIGLGMLRLIGWALRSRDAQ